MIVHGTAVLRRDKTVEVNLAGGGKDLFQGNAVIIATGAVPIVPNIPGIDLPGCGTATGCWPRRLEFRPADHHGRQGDRGGVCHDLQ